jgi:enoyl-CoA hydratase
MEYRRLGLRLEAPIARITLSLGAGSRIDARALRELDEAAAAISAGEGIALAVIDAEGPDFCLGWADDARAEVLAFGTSDAFGGIAGLACPVVAAVQGGAIGAGLELAMAADLRVCCADARFGLPDVALGQLPLAGGSQRLPRLAGRTRAAAMLLLGDELDAPGALAAGLVSRVFAKASFREDCDAVAARIGAMGPIALRYAKEAVHNGLEMTLEQGLRYELDLSVLLQTTADRAEGVRAFIEKRPPHFEGR